MTDIVLTVDLIPMTTPGPVTPARGTKRRHQEPDEGVMMERGTMLMTASTSSRTRRRRC